MTRPRREIALVETFLAPHVLTLPQLCQRLRCSRATILRRLGEHGYYSSYNHSGTFLTVEEVADFDSRGLWAWKTARFSRHGNLKQTLMFFVEDSKEGMTHEELATLLGVRTHNTLLELVHEEKIRRERLGPTFVYVSRKTSIRTKQVRRRKSLLAQPPKPRPTSRQTIATLLQLIKEPVASRQQIVLRCQRSGVSIRRELVDAIFEPYALDQKRAR